MNERTITFRLGEENGIVIQKDSFETSLFLNQYQQAIDIFDRLWKEQQEWAKSSNSSYYLDNQFSNVIAFCGDRGEGKTSCMSSFATILTDEHVRGEACSKKGDENKKPIIISTDFLRPQEIEWLDTIDPSFFDRKHNLLELLLGRMYANVSRRSQGNISNNDRDKSYDRRLLMEQFERVKSDISKIAKNDKIYDSLEEISDLAAGVNLKSDLHELFNRYLKYMGKKCLLICIDDLDLNISEGYRMAEMLRKYLICPQCIILVAVKVGQLIEVIATAHRKEIKVDDISWERCMYMAQKYVAKLFPRGNRVIMPIPTDFYEYNLEIVCSKKSKPEEENNSKEKEPKFTVKEKVVQMIFQKTGYVFYNTQHLSPIIPKNLRSLRHLLGMLYSVPDAKDANGNDNEIGRDTFKNYFFGTWAAQLPDKDYTFAQQLAQYDDLTTLNAFVVEYFANRVENDTSIKILETDLNEEYAKLYLSITSKKNTATNISYGDVMYVLWFINGITLHMTIQNLIFLIKTFYSMRLYACYNVVSSNEEELYPPTPEVEKAVHIHKAETLYEHVNQLQKLLNGSYFTYPQSAFLPTVGRDNTAFRDRVIVHISKLKPLLCRIKEGAKKEDVRLCEYLALCISRSTTSKENILDLGLNRSEKIPTYLGTLSSTADYFVFDFLHPFFSLCNIEYAYRRFDDMLGLNKKKDVQVSLFEIAQKTEGSLYRSFLDKYKDKKDLWDKQHALISDAVIRVSEVQWAIYDELLRKRNLYKDGDDSIFSAYNAIQNLRIKLYPIIGENNEQTEPGTLVFSFLTELLLVNKKELTKILYMSKEDKLQQEMRIFVEDFSIALLNNTYIWPIDGKIVKDIIIQASRLKDTRKGILTRKLTKIFNNDEYYTREQLMSERFNDIIREYMAVINK